MLASKGFPLMAELGHWIEYTYRVPLTTAAATASSSRFLRWAIRAGEERSATTCSYHIHGASSKRLLDQRRLARRFPALFILHVGIDGFSKFGLTLNDRLEIDNFVQIKVGGQLCSQIARVSNLSYVSSNSSKKRTWDGGNEANWPVCLWS